MQDKKSLIADSLHGSIMLSEYEKDIMVTTLFNRLHDIYQNSTAYMTFPSNRTKRMEHSLGCMFLCGDLFYSSICNCEEDIIKEFIAVAEKEIEDILNRINSSEGKKYEYKLGGAFQKSKSQYDKLYIFGGLYNYYTPANLKDDTQRKVYCLLYEGIRVAALLHDIGHPPYSHISENALNYLYSEIQKQEEKNTAEEEFVKILDGKIDDNHQLHEEMGIHITEMILMDTIDDISETGSRKDSIYQKQLHRILVKEIVLQILNEETTFFKDLHTVIDGTLDGDRLDYVSRDPENSGFRLGMTEYDRLVYKMKLCRYQSHFIFCPNVSAVKTVEDFLTRRWNLYKNIIFHHRVIKTDYLLQSAIIEIAMDYFKTEYRNKKPEENYILPYNISGLWKANKDMPSSRESAYALSQWNDAWLLTVLKKAYFEKYIEEESYLHDQLEEFLTNKKHYFSLIKRKEEFQEIDIEVSKVIADKKDELLNKIEELQEQSAEMDETGGFFDIAGYLDAIKEIIAIAEQNKDKSFVGTEGFTLCKIKRKIFGIASFSVILDKVKEELGFEQGELFYAQKEPKTGTNKDLYFYRKTDGKNQFVSLNSISNISGILGEDLNYSPFFFIYVNNKVDVKKENLRKQIGISMGHALVSYMMEKISEFIDK